MTRVLSDMVYLVGIQQRAQTTRTWRKQAKCAELSPSQADAIFFVGSGGKSKKAREYCAGCPVLNKCLDEALKSGHIGMWAGTTDEERRRMAKFIGAVQLTMPPEPTISTRRLRRIQPKYDPLADPLADLDGPSVDELRMLG